MLKVVKGRCVKIAFADDVDLVLRRGDADRPAARFNRRGEDALYLSPDELSARVAIGQYVTAETRQRVLLTYELGECRLCDLRHPQAAEIYELARQSWLTALDEKRTPASWEAADIVRQAGYDGLIDPSRRRPGLWHITLFRWNEPGSPQVRRILSPEKLTLDLDFR